ncbi:MAG: dephospho-CoA kinase [Actinobacteria bacterium]|nr:MAG: dephospho-CoA kinase [Actinomycetota bacterium]
MFVVGITGAIATGKSTLSRFLKEKGAIVIDADKIAKELLDTPALGKKVLTAFGQGIMTDNTIDRKKLGSIVFSNTLKLDRLNKLLLPEIIKVIEEELSLYSKTLPNNQILVLDAPLLIEANLLPKVDYVIVVTASPELQLERLLSKNLTIKESRERMGAQIKEEARLKHADVVIKNDSDIGNFKQKTEKLWQDLQKKSRL